MPEIRVRLGRHSNVLNGVVGGKEILEVLKSLRSMMVTLGITSDEKFVEIEVTYDQYDLDINIEPLKISISIELTENSRIKVLGWLRALENLLADELDKQKVPKAAIDYVQVCFILGGHQAGVLCDRRTGHEFHNWCDEGLEYPVPWGQTQTRI